MSRREDILNDVWEDLPFADLSGTAQHVYVWSWTNRFCNLAGLYKCQLRDIGAGKWPPDVLERALAELAAAGMLVFDPPYLWNCARVKRLTSKSPSIARAVAKDIAQIDPDVPLRKKFLDRYQNTPWLADALRDMGVDTVSTPCPDSADLSEKATPSGHLPREVTTSGSGQRTGSDTESTTDHTRARALTYRGKPVARDIADQAHRLLDVFNDAAGRELNAPEHLRKIAGALIRRPDVTVEQWETATRNTVSNPPGFVDGEVQLGHIYGENAADHALANTGKPADPDRERRARRGAALERVMAGAGA